MKTFAKITVAMLVLASFGLESCKKGEGDPFMSLRSRKGRMAGEWKVSAGKGTDMSGSTTSTWVYDGTTETTTWPSPMPQTTDKYTDEYTIEKDGTFTNVHTDNNGSSPVVTTTTGTWNFTGGVGEMKNKSQAVFTILSISNPGGTVTYTGSDAPSAIMDIYQLKSKEIIVKSKGTTSTPNSSTESEWTWTAK